ncbi:MAG TPA: 50S ribosomal protein L17 [Thermoanaerobaculia bacterium]|nr:50S ribosomal protein L17 [Thermoanaerobaculia bacterium]HUM30667.1 50S ribosomal protein L17 [Thermoanaerobaculia bacterium]HXK68925.1 50S ribosomal protein L17 [Thermoanaerobaculia bacterium]
MRHNMAGRKLGRTTEHRKALFRNQLQSFFKHERIVLTLPQAKELRRLAERMITWGKKDSLHARRIVRRDIPDRQIVKRLFDEVAPRFVDRAGGYTRILKIGPRKGDGAEMAILQLVDYTFKVKEKKEK